MLQFESLTEEQIDKMGLIEKGQYDFKVIEATNKIARSGNPVIEIKIRIRDKDNIPRTMTDYLGTNGQFMMRKLRHFCRSTGLMSKYDAKKVTAEDVLDAMGRLETDIESGRPRDDDPSKNWPDKAIIVDYIGDKDPAAKAKDDDFDNALDIPF